MWTVFEETKLEGKLEGEVKGIIKVLKEYNESDERILEKLMSEFLSLLFLGGTFLIALLAYIDRNNKRK